MKYEVQQGSIEYNLNDEQHVDEIETIYKHSQELIDDDEIEDWEQGFMQGYAEA